ncbi:unnamed protein product [Medioppia subpectinata]|uniref:Uncharacterized protein n=1 Tax=Medioppia subpectinata TaxID=1979941 RepID=A0A7R9KE08_9ACAR|nr:unnamed protein product [Medioppia subpectinata]CAG2101820.1 unnamed protein product [Medioppia subpectinata]
MPRTMRSILLSCLVVMCGMYAYRCATINFSAWRTSTVYKNFDLKCNYTLVRKSEFFSNPTFYKIKGIDKIVKRTPGYISINNANKTTSGLYRCQVNYSGGRILSVLIIRKEHIV